MTKAAVIQTLENQQLKKSVPDFKIGDTVRVHTRIIEGNKERIQVFTGTVIARKGTGISETFSVHRVAYGEGMERVFPLHSPRVAEIEVVKHGRVRRAKLYYLRGTSGKKSKVKNVVGGRRSSKATTEAEPLEEEQVEVDAIETQNVDSNEAAAESTAK